ncbi:acyltransferase family protein [Scytonema millei]|uniref:Acyltransferase n=1 Tax=Scytonema millei VB511283 TaxID=1245923 RepID=A0A9X5E4F3_9CYAN|nr:acyltransferase family protein [Scytonema millei]NHC34623.1 acyltransferase [Scytonema millei VB511283]
MQTYTQSTATRVFPLDVLKALSILAVVSFHAIFVHPSAYASVGSALDILFAPLKFCVPVFLTISFFLLQRGIDKNFGQSNYFLLKKRLLRLLIPTIFWFGVALLIRKFIWYRTKEELLLSLFQGTIYPGSYYLLILLQLIPCFVWLYPWLNRHRFIAATLILQCLVFLGVYLTLSGAFANWLPQILENLHRPFFIYWFGYMALGSLLSKHWYKVIKISQRLPTIVKVILLLLASTLLIIESIFLSSLTEPAIAPYDYMMLSCIFSVFVCFLCFASVTEDSLSITGRKIVKLLSTYSLGIYCINGVTQTIFHAFFVTMFPDATFNLLEILVMKTLGFILLLSVSIGVSLLIDKLGGSALVR